MIQRPDSTTWVPVSDGVATWAPASAAEGWILAGLAVLTVACFVVDWYQRRAR